MVNELVSIVMATFNGEKYLREQLNSILEQTHQHFELVVVDDASTDKTLSILHEYSILDDRIHIFPAEKNIGLVANFERGLGLAKGEFIALSDQDDIFRKDKIELLLTALKDHPKRDLVISDLSLIDADGNNIAHSMWRYSKLRPRQGKPFQRLLYANYATGCAMMCTRRLLNLAMPFPPDCAVHDWWLAVVAASSKAGGICLVNQQLTSYRQHGSNVLGAIEGLKMRTIISRITAPPRGQAGFENRMRLYKQDMNRLTGYLQRSIWSSMDRMAIEKGKALFVDYASDAHSNFISRTSKLPTRLRYAWQAGGITFCLSVIRHTLLPNK